MPGQLVVYPIIDVSKQKLSVRDYVGALESTVIDTLDFFGIHAARDPDLPGVWVKGSKICAIGVRVKSRVTMHGLALNINNDLGLFGKIVPCGIRTRSVTSMSNILETKIAFEDVRFRLLSAIINRLQNN
jgi:lipoate-protein ligase B